MVRFAVMPGRTPVVSSFFTMMRVEKPLMPFLIVACGAMRSSRPKSFSPGTASTSICTFWFTARRVTSAWLMCALMMSSLRSATVSTSVPLFTPLAPDTAWPTDTGRVRTVQSKGATILVFVSLSSTTWSADCDRARLFCEMARPFFEVSTSMRLLSKVSFETSFCAKRSLFRMNVMSFFSIASCAVVTSSFAPSISIWRCDFSVCRSVSSSVKRTSPFFTLSPMSTGSLSMRPLTSGRTETCSAGVISPAALMAKLMSRTLTRPVVGRADFFPVSATGALFQNMTFSGHRLAAK